MKRYIPISKKKEQQRIFQSMRQTAASKKELQTLDQIVHQSVMEMKKSLRQQDQ